MQQKQNFSVQRITMILIGMNQCNYNALKNAMVIAFLRAIDWSVISPFLYLLSKA